MLDSPAILLSGVVIGLIGMALLLYGKKQPDLRCLAVGAGLCILPALAHSVVVMWLITGVCCSALWITRRGA